MHGVEEATEEKEVEEARGKVEAVKMVQAKESSKHRQVQPLVTQRGSGLTSKGRFRALRKLRRKTRMEIWQPMTMTLPVRALE